MGPEPHSRQSDSQTLRQSDPAGRQSDKQTVRPGMQTVRQADLACSQTVCLPGLSVLVSDCLRAGCDCLTV